MAKAKASAERSPAATNVTLITEGRKPHSLGAEAPDDVCEVGAANPAPAVIVFGKDEGGKAHASRFGEADAELAIKAAGLMGYRVLRVTSPDIADKATELPPGRIFTTSGRGFVPFCKTAVYEALSGFEGAFAPPPPPKPEPEPEIAATGPASSWETITVGNLVLASIDGEDQWWPSLVTEARGEDIFVLKWVGYPDELPFARRRDALGLLPPAPVVAEADPAATADPAA